MINSMNNENKLKDIIYKYLYFDDPSEEINEKTEGYVNYVDEEKIYVSYPHVEPVENVGVIGKIIETFKLLYDRITSVWDTMILF